MGGINEQLSILYGVVFEHSMVRLVPIHSTRVNAEGSFLSRSIKQTREGSVKTTESCSATTSRQYTKQRQLLSPYTSLTTSLG